MGGGSSGGDAIGNNSAVIGGGVVASSSKPAENDNNVNAASESSTTSSRLNSSSSMALGSSAPCVNSTDSRSLDLGFGVGSCGGSESAGGCWSSHNSNYYDSSSSSCIHLTNGVVLYLREVESMLALVCLTREEGFEKRGLLDYNIEVFKEAMRKLIRVMRESGN